MKDRFKCSPLDDAIKFRHKEIVKTLRKAGARLIKTSMETAVELCRLAAKNRVEDLQVWQLAGVDLNSCDYDRRTPLHVVSLTNDCRSLLKSILTDSTTQTCTKTCGEHAEPCTLQICHFFLPCLKRPCFMSKGFFLFLNLVPKDSPLHVGVKGRDLGNEVVVSFFNLDRGFQKLPLTTYL